MKGYIYIASAFETVNRSICGRHGSWVDNDPHYWSDPPTWGICRNDLRADAKKGDVVFFVLPRQGRYPQTIFGYLTIEKVVTHATAYHIPSLVSKRMGDKEPNGNIIVDAQGRYNEYDGGVHQHQFARIARRYAIGDPSRSRMLTDTQLRKKAPTFLPTLISVLGKTGARPIDVITRRGAKLAPLQVHQLMRWLNAP